MTRIADLLDRDFSRPIEEIVKVNNHDPDTVLMELTEYIATDRIKRNTSACSPRWRRLRNRRTKALESGFRASSARANLPFAKNLGYVLANREVHGAPAQFTFLKQVESSGSPNALSSSIERSPMRSSCSTSKWDLPPQSRRGADRRSHVPGPAARSGLRGRRRYLGARD